jgi:hypothetical protein
LCTRTVGVLAHVFEAAGLATVGLSLVRGQAERVRAPRMLHCQFPLGRPLGRPGDPDFQHDVLRRALSLLSRTDVPVLVDHPAVIEDEADMPAACPLPPRFDADAHPAVTEARGLRAAYDRQIARTGRTLVGRVGDADSIEHLVRKFVRIAEGALHTDVGFDDHSVLAASQDIRAYYEEAALALVDHVPAARQTESWFYRSTVTGEVLRAARDALRAADAPGLVTGYLLPATQ